MLTSPTTALLWDIWRRHRSLFLLAIVVAASGRILQARSAEPNESLLVMLRFASYAILFGIFSYTESSDSRGLGRFPRRLFVLPVTSARLVAVPSVAGLVCVEALYLVWLEPGVAGGLSSAVLDAALLGALLLSSQTVIWTLDRLGALRLIVVGALAVAAFWVDLLPSFAPTPPPVWRSPSVLTLLSTCVALIALSVSWRHIARARCESVDGALPLSTVAQTIGGLVPRRGRAFRSAAAAHFWFEWRSSGVVLPALVAGVLIVFAAPLSWLMRHDPADTLHLLAGVLGMPIFLAMAVGTGFGKPRLWSDDLTFPAFLAVRPMTNDAVVATKVKVAAASAAASWLLVVAFAGVWLALWGNLDALSGLAIQLWAFHGQSVMAVVLIGALIVCAGLLVTWRLLITRLWSGMRGDRRLFFASALSLGVVVLAALVFDASRLPAWILDEPAHMRNVVLAAGAVVGAKYWLAARTWRRIDGRYVRQYLLVWVGATAAWMTLALVVWNVARIYAALDIYLLQALLILGALLAVPVARVGFAASCLARNRHQA
jgi:hypothetical protein